MAVEQRWRTHIREFEGRYEGQLYRTEPVDVPGLETVGVQVRFLDVPEAGSNGMDAGIYIETNVAPQGFEVDKIRDGIGNFVVQTLASLSPMTATSEPEADVLNSIVLIPQYITDKGALILQVKPASYDEVSQAVSEYIQGSNKVRFTPNS